MKISKILAAFSAAAILATMGAVSVSADAETVAAKNVGFNIQFGHFYGGTVTATVKGAGVMSMTTTDEGLACTGEVVGETTMYSTEDWASSFKNVEVKDLAIADTPGEKDNPGWNGMWLQFYATDLSDIEITISIDATDGTWKDMDPADDTFAGWTVLRAMDVGGSSEWQVITTEADGTQPATKTYEYKITADMLQAAVDAGKVTPKDEDVAVANSSSTADSSKTDSKSDSTSSTDSASKTDSKATTSSKAANSTAAGTTSKSGAAGTGTSSSASDDKTADTGATAGIALAGIALAGAAIVVAKRK